MHSIERKNPSEQARIAAWFDRTYDRRGLRYLRPRRAYAVFLDILEVTAGQQLLDVACGPGQLLAEGERRGLRTCGVDISPVAVTMARQRVPAATVSVANAERLPFADASFDYITCLGSLERVLDRDAALEEMARVVRPEGRLCLMVRNSHSLQWKFVERLGRQNTEGHQGADGLGAWTSAIERTGLHCVSVLPDQWPLMWRERIAHRLGLRMAPRIRRSGLLPLGLTNEFVFLLQRAGDK